MELSRGSQTVRVASRKKARGWNTDLGAGTMETSMTTKHGDIDRSTVRNREPDGWDCETLLHVCTDCARLTRGLRSHTQHYAEDHPDSMKRASGTCIALPADDWYWPYDGRITVEEIQSSLTNGNPPNTVEQIVG